MATWTKHPTPHRGESRRCGWYSSCALALGAGLLPCTGSKSRTSGFVQRDVMANSIGVRAAGPPG